ADHPAGRPAAIYLQSYGDAAVRALTVASRTDFDRLSELVDGTPLLTPKALLWTADDEGAAHLEDLLESVPQLRSVAPAAAIGLCPALRPENLALAAED